MFDSELLKDADWEDLMVRSCYSSQVFSSTFLPDTFHRGFAPGAQEIFEALDGDYQKVLIIAHRGLGKTSICSMGYPLKKICFRESKFTVLVSATATSAQMNAVTLQSQIVGNSNITSLFGNLRDPLVWSKEGFKVGDTYVLPRGAEQQVRGMNYESHRPDLIIVDDLECSEGVESPERRLKLKKWFYSDLMNSVDRGSDNWRIIVIGTILHESSLLSELAEDPSWKVVRVAVCDENFKSLHPEFMSDEKILELYSSFRAIGHADVFAREYQNMTISKEDAVFQQEFFKDYDPADIIDNKDITFVTIVDPAKTVKLHSADSAIITVGIDLVGHKIFFHDCVAGKMYPDELYDKTFEQILAHGSRMLGIEVTGLNEFITQPIKNEMKKRGVFAHFVELHARSKKEMRIAQLAPFYRQGYILHNPAISQKLEMQLMAFPKSALVDVSDAFAYVIEMMELDDKYFYAEELPGCDEYDSLENEKPLRDWEAV